MREGVYFEMILMDIIMPVMGGYESTEQIRKIEKEFSITGADRHFICGFTAMVTSATAQKCSDCGMNRMLSKPMSADVLCQLLAENRRITNTFAE